VSEDLKKQSLNKIIKLVYFQKWIGGKESKNSGTDFYIEFEAPLSPRY
jgi:hypothetical protein